MKTNNKNKFCGLHRTRYAKQCIECQLYFDYPIFLKSAGINRLRKEILVLRKEGRNKTFINKKILLVRHLRNNKKLSFPEIGKLLHRDHSTIVYLYYKK